MSDALLIKAVRHLANALNVVDASKFTGYEHDLYVYTKELNSAIEALNKIPRTRNG